jgi:hypothetical protein
MKKEMEMLTGESAESRRDKIGAQKEKSGILGGKAKEKGGLRKLKSLVIFVLIFMVWVVAMQFVVAQKYEVAVDVAENGVEAESRAAVDGLDFGLLPHGESSMRFITIKNDGDRDVYVKIYKLGKAGKFLEINRNDFTLKAGEMENLEFTLNVPSGAKEKRYEGKVFIFQVPEMF